MGVSSLRSQGLRFLLCCALSVTGLAGQALAQPKPTGLVVLSVGAPAGKPNRVSADFDMAALERLPQVNFTTATPWYGQPTKFSGPLLRDVLAAAGVTGTRLVAVALNDYKVEMPLEDATRHGAVLALRMNDKPMSVRDKGPLFVVFNYDSAAELRSERYYTRSIWQLRRLQVD
jgi:hypothetical protein